uniref:Phosphoinositide interacting regulator of transient receptor potential channels n=1 Tax=Oryzias latipes TaxID=8090 RepID=A0A3P9IXV7_ORYLA
MGTAANDNAVNRWVGITRTGGDLHRPDASGAAMEAAAETYQDGAESLCPDAPPAGDPCWTYLHKPITAVVMGSVMGAAGALLLLLHRSVDAPRSVGSACLSVGLMFVAVGLVWIPVLREKQRRKRFIQEARFLHLKIYF